LIDINRTNKRDKLIKPLILSLTISILIFITSNNNKLYNNNDSNNDNNSLYNNEYEYE
jgi:hypothetical protein